MNKNKIDLTLPSHITIDETFEFELQKFIYKKSYYEFFKKAFTILHPGELYNDNWHVKLICDRLQEEVHRITQKKVKKKDIIINIPFRSSKSMICSVIFLPWVWITYPHLKFIYVSFSESLALEHAQFSKNLINSEWYQKFFGDCFSFNRSEDSKHFYANTNGGFRKSVGTGGAITGSGADFLFCLPAGQKIITNKGELDIKDIVEKKISVKILSYNYDLKKFQYKKIKKYFKNKGRKLLKFTLESGKELICTENHSIWTKNRGYVKASEINENDILLIR